MEFQYFIASCSATGHSSLSSHSCSSRNHSRPPSSSSCSACRQSPRRNWPSSPACSDRPSSLALFAQRASPTYSPASWAQPALPASWAQPALPASWAQPALPASWHTLSLLIVWTGLLHLPVQPCPPYLLLWSVLFMPDRTILLLLLAHAGPLQLACLFSLLALVLMLTRPSLGPLPAQAGLPPLHIHLGFIYLCLMLEGW